MNYVECDVDVHEYCWMARKGAHGSLDFFSQMQIDMAFVVEGRNDEELPEVRVRRMHTGDASTCMCFVFVCFVC